jgi:predicted RNA-binding Zn-ribbon protein involved in translation (DUF1610 family)
MAESEESASEGAAEVCGEARSVFACPNCGQEFEITPAASAQIVQCPACEGQVVIPSLDGSTELPLDYENPNRADTELEQTDSETERSDSELDGLRMRQIVTARRAAIRSRTYMLLGAMLCAVGCAKLITLIVPLVRRDGWTRLAMGYAIFVGLGVVGTVYCLRRAAELNQESKATPIPEPPTPPDFTSLSDGSQQAKNLEEIR